ncbi:hypothetical protein HMPREF9374_3682 [Desmospora sp. 8437]|nr:hypothetical protein HMPREF9374_3682 [Desmospora sp. 8437]
MEQPGWENHPGCSLVFGLLMRAIPAAGALQDPQEQKHHQDADGKADPLPGPRGEGEGMADVIFVQEPEECQNQGGLQPDDSAQPFVCPGYGLTA